MQYFLILFIFIFFNIFPQKDIFSQTTNQTNQLKNNTAVIWWVGYNNKRAFRKNKQYLSNIFSKIDGVFNVPKANIYSVKTKTENFLNDFEDKLLTALDKIKDKKKPTLIIALSSHGKKDFISQQKNKDLITYQKIIKMINKYVYSNNLSSAIKIEYYIDTCYSGSIIRIIKNNLPKDFVESEKEVLPYKSIDTEKTNIYKYKVEVFTSSPSNKVSYGNKNGSEFLLFINSINIRENIDPYSEHRYNKETLYKYLYARRENLSYFMYWRSFDKDKVLFLLNKEEWDERDNNEACEVLSQDYSFRIKKMIFCHSKQRQEKTHLLAATQRQIMILLEAKEWPKEFWKEIPIFIKKNKKLREKISYMLKNKNKWTKKVWKKIPILMKDKNKNIRKNIIFALYNQSAWTPKVVRQIKNSKYPEIQSLEYLIPEKIGIVEYLKFP